MRSLVAATLAVASIASYAPMNVQSAAWDSCELPAFDWVVSDQGTGQSMAYAVVPEPTGIWIAGSFSKSMKVQGPSGSLTITSTTVDTADDCYIAKIDFNGGVVSAKAIQGPGRQLVIDGSFDTTNNRLVIAGYHLGNITFAPTMMLQNKKSIGSGHFDGFIASLDVSGSNPTAVWAKSYENTRSTKYSGVSVGPNGNPIGIGNTCAEDKTKTPDVNTGLYPDVCSGFVEIFNKDDGSQEHLLTYSNFMPETVRNDGATAYIVGRITVAQDFVTGSGTVTLTPIGKSDIVVVKINTSTGVIEYAVQYGVAGKTYIAWEINLGTTSFYVNGGDSSGSFDGFLIKGSKSNGAKVFEVDAPYARGVQVDTTESYLYLMGLFSGSITLSSNYVLRSRGSYETFVLKMSASTGEGRWGMSMGGDGMEYPWSMFRDASNDIYVSGLTASSTAKFGDKTFIDNAVGYSNMFITKIKASTESMPSCLSSCSSVTTGCFIDGVCYASGASSPFQSQGCFKCTPATSATSWVGPDTASGNWCYIDSSCVAKDKYRDITTNSVTSTSRCQKCEPTSSSNTWSLVAGYALDTDQKTCKSDGSIPTGSVTPGCSGSQTRNENFCGTVTPCYDSATDSCNAAITVCANGLVYSDDCPSFPLKPCYNAATGQCVDSTYSSTSNGINCGTTGQYIYVDKCPSDHPCYDHVNRVCVAAQKSDVKSNAMKQTLTSGVAIASLTMSAVAMLVAA